MTKFNVKALGLKKDIDIDVTNAVVEKVANANLALATSLDMANKDDNQIMKEAIAANKAEKLLLINVLKLSEKEAQRIVDTIPSNKINVWLKEFTTAVFMVRNYGMSPQEMERLQKSSQHSE